MIEQKQPIAICLILTLTLSACAINPATGKKQLSLVGERDEVAMGKQYDKQTMASLRPYGSAELQSYIQQLGTKLAATSERADLTWTFRLVDDPVVNAFALPGGFIYITRGLLTHMTSEAELAAVIGHETGHVTARHSVSQMSKQTLLGGLLGIGSILSPELQQYSGILTQGMQTLFLKFSRDDERQADELGLRYLVRAGYDPRPMAGVYETLGNVSRLEGGGGLPAWMSTHPAPEDRRQSINAQIVALNRSFDGLPVERESFLRRLDGVTFGENPREGFFEGTVFFHPDLKLRFDLPASWTGVNQPASVIGLSPAKDAVVRMTLSDKPTPDAAAAAFFAQQGMQRGAVAGRPVHAHPAVLGDFRVTNADGTMAGTAAFIAHDGKVFQLVGFTTLEKWGTYEAPLRATLGSFRTLTDPKILAIEPARIEIVKIDRDMTLDEFQRKYPSSISLERLAVANHVDKAGRLSAGQSYKRIVGGKKPA